MHSHSCLSLPESSPPSLHRNSEFHVLILLSGSKTLPQTRDLQSGRNGGFGKVVSFGSLFCVIWLCPGLVSVSQGTGKPRSASPFAAASHLSSSLTGPSFGEELHLFLSQGVSSLSLLPIVSPLLAQASKAGTK